MSQSGPLTRCPRPGSVAKCASLCSLMLITLGLTDRNALADQYSEFRDGFVDVSFGDNGELVVNPALFTSVSDMTVTGNGTLFLAGQATPESEDDNPTLFLFDNNGAPGPVLTFAQPENGCAMVSGKFRKLMSEASGSVLAGGYASCDGNSDFLLMRLDDEGNESLTFEHPEFSGGNESIREILIQSTGRIIALGNSTVPDVSVHIVAAGFDPQGTLDSSFGDAGETAHSNEDLPRAAAAALQGDNIIVAGSGSGGFSAMRFLSDGEFDPTFGDNGVASATFDEYRASEFTNDVAVQPDGKIVVLGYASAVFGIDLNLVSSIKVVRFNPDGSLDDSFGDDGLVGFKANLPNPVGELLLIEPDGKLLIAGSTHGPYLGDFGGGFALARVYENGMIDKSFGNGGSISWNSSFLRINTPNALVAPSENTMLMAGTSSPFDFSGTTSSEILLTRFHWRKVIFDSSFGTSSP